MVGKRNTHFKKLKICQKTKVLQSDGENLYYSKLRLFDLTKFII